MIAIFLSTGITSWIYRFLGGIQGASFGWRAFKVGGTLGALMVVAHWIDGRLEDNMKYLETQAQTRAAARFHLASDDLIVGDWAWDVIGASASWTGHLDFKKENEQLIFSDEEFNWERRQAEISVHSFSNSAMVRRH